MKYSGELKIGLTSVITIIVIIWGINYLKGRNILSSNYELVSLYNEVNGLEASASVVLNGFKIGTVSEIKFETEKNTPFTVILEIDKKYLLRKGSIAEIYSADLLGSMSIRIVPAENDNFHQAGDTLKSSMSTDMISLLMNKIDPLTVELSSAIQTLDSVGGAINMLIRDPSIANMINHLENVSSSLDNKFKESGDVNETFRSLKNLSSSLEDQTASIQQSISNVESITSDLKNADLDSLINKLALTSSSLAEITNAIESGEGSIGKLIYEDSLHDQLNLLVMDLDSLIKDINENPKKYVGFSLFGK
jgi:phospholipid/cholesterol/gamma-HCH transport system substrate-binding protein